VPHESAADGARLRVAWDHVPLAFRQDARALFEGEAGEHLRAVIRRQIDDLAQRAPQLGNADAILNFTQKIDH
jgi:hypothetical protein